VFIKGLLLLPFTSLSNLLLVLLKQNQIPIKYKFPTEDKLGIYGLLPFSRAPWKYQATSGSCTYEMRNIFGTDLHICILKMQQLLCSLQDWC